LSKTVSRLSGAEKSKIRPHDLPASATWEGVNVYRWYLRQATVEFGVLLQHTLSSGVERAVWLGEKVVDAESCHLFNGQALALAQLFQPPHFFILEGYRERCHNRLLCVGDAALCDGVSVGERTREGKPLKPTLRHIDEHGNVCQTTGRCG
jgi:hypothetical protein